jgi:hypothetical protein
MNKIHISQVQSEGKTITFQRKPSPWEVKFGYGAMHYREFEISELLDKKGYIKRRIKAKNDGLVYTYF